MLNHIFVRLDTIKLLNFYFNKNIILKTRRIIVFFDIITFNNILYADIFSIFISII